MASRNFKLLQFPPIQKKNEKKFSESFVEYIKNLFKHEKGYDKYRFVSWTFYKDIERTAVTYQNLKDGMIHEYVFPVQGRLEWKTVDTWLRNKR
jgi:hypothetical protein